MLPALAPFSTPPDSHLSLGLLRFPRSAITELYGSGKTTLLLSALSAATQQGETCAWIDASNSFDPVSASAAGVLLHRLLWVRCAHETTHAFRCTDLILKANGFGLIVLDLAGVELRSLQRIPVSYWYRFRRAAGQSNTVLVVISPLPQVRQSAALAVETRWNQTRWSGDHGCSRLLDGVELDIQPRKPPGLPVTTITARAL